MSSDRFRLDRPPIIEAVVDVVCDLPPALDLARIQDQAKSRFRDVYPIARRQIIQSNELYAQPETPPEVAVRQQVDALQFLAEDEKQLVQVRLEGYSFNRLAPYSSLDDYLPEIERTYGIFRELAEPIQIRRIGLRYINRLLLPTIDGQVELNEYLRVSPHLSDENALQFLGFFNQHSAVEVATGNRVNVTLAIESLERDRLPLIFDIDAYDQTARPPDDWPAMREAIGSLRRLKNNVFEKTLSDRCLNLYRQQ
jgi:uncharacterized protein (TIGR04255 family)